MVVFSGPDKQDIFILGLTVLARNRGEGVRGERRFFFSASAGIMSCKPYNIQHFLYLNLINA
jgi:hypothetical protein